MNELLREVWLLLRARKKLWMLPLVLLLLMFGVLIVFVAASPVAPFIYTAF